MESVPSRSHPHALQALRTLMQEAREVRAAVAFVTHSGVDLLAEVLSTADQALRLEVIARGAPITEQDALVRLREELGAAVSIVMGPRAPAYHPKLWLFRTPEELLVLSGSGNLTRGGLRENDEQFEVMRCQAGTADAGEQEERFARLVQHAIPLEEAERTPAWLEWKAQGRARRRLDDERRRLDEKLASRVAVNREDDKRALCADLERLYQQTVAARLPRSDGRPYVPSRFKQAIDRARAANNPVPVVARICRRQSDGFDVILRANRPDLTVESLVVDSTKPYHDLFPEETRAMSAARLRQFPSLEKRPSDLNGGRLDARALLASLVGKKLLTIGTNQPNRILRLESDSAVVATTRSPDGQRVPIEWVQLALDALERDRRLNIDVPSVGHRSAFVGAVLREMPAATVDGQAIVLSGGRPAQTG